MKIITNKRNFFFCFSILILIFNLLNSIVFAQYRYLPELYQPQNLPKVEAKLADKKLNLMLARTDYQKAKGLMFYKEIASDTGMLFIYNTPHKMSFWMMNTRIPLDLIFFSKDLVVTEYIKDMKPGYGINPNLLPHYDSKGDAQYALELKSGCIDEFQIKIGDRLEIPQILLYSDY